MVIYYDNFKVGGEYVEKASSIDSKGNTTNYSQNSTGSTYSERRITQNQSYANGMPVYKVYDPLPQSIDNTAKAKIEQNRNRNYNVQEDTNNNYNNPISTAWDYARNKQSSGSWLSNLYDKIDYGLFGYAPGGLTPDMVSSMDNETEAIEKNIGTGSIQKLTHAEQRRQQAEIEKDYSTEKWYENFLGTHSFQSDSEVFYQDMLKKQQDQNIFNDLLNSKNDVKEDIIIPKEADSNIFKYAALAVGALILMVGLKK